MPSFYVATHQEAQSRTAVNEGIGPGLQCLRQRQLPVHVPLAIVQVHSVVLRQEDAHSSDHTICLLVRPQDFISLYIISLYWSDPTLDSQTYFVLHACRWRYGA